MSLQKGAGQYRPAPASAGPAAGGPAPHRRAVPSLGSFPFVIDLLVRRLSIVDIPRGENLAMLGSTFSDFLRSLSKSAEASATRVPVNVLGGSFSSLQFSRAPFQSAPRSHPKETLEVALIRGQVKAPGRADPRSLGAAMRSRRGHAGR